MLYCYYVLPTQTKDYLILLLSHDARSLASQPATTQWPCFTQQPDMGCQQRPPGGCATWQLVGPTYSKKRLAAVQPLSFLSLNSFLLLH